MRVVDVDDSQEDVVSATLPSGVGTDTTAIFIVNSGGRPVSPTSSPTSSRLLPFHWPKVAGEDMSSRRGVALATMSDNEAFKQRRPNS